MIKITLRQIKEHDPCKDGWDKIYAAQGPDLDEPFNLVEALDSNGFDDTVWALRCLSGYDNLWKRYARWCAERVTHLTECSRINPSAIVTIEEAARAKSVVNWVYTAAARANTAALATSSVDIARATVEAAAAARAAHARANSVANWVNIDSTTEYKAQEEKLREILTTGEWSDD